MDKKDGRRKNNKSILGGDTNKEKESKDIKDNRKRKMKGIF